MAINTTIIENKEGYMQIITMSRNEISDLNIDVPHMVISISDPDLDPVYIKKSENLVHVERLQFHDIDRDLHGCIRMDCDMADRIVKAFKKYESRCEVIICQCEAGVSRSAGVAVAIGEYIGIPYENLLKRYPVYNRYVNDKIVRAFKKDDENG